MIKTDTFFYVNVDKRLMMPSENSRKMTFRIKKNYNTIPDFNRPQYIFLWIAFILFLFCIFPMKSLAVETDLKDEKPASATDEKEKEKKVLTLDECINLSLKIHPELKSANALKNAAGAQLTQTMSAYYPQVSFRSTYNRAVSHNVVVSQGVIAQRGTNNSDAYSSTMSLSQNIYDFGRTHYDVMAAKESLNATKYDLLTTSDGIILDIKSNYYEAVASERVLDVNRETVSQQELHLKQAIGFYKVGRRSRIEVTKAEVDLAKAKLELIKSENAVKLSRVKLANSIGLSESFNYALDSEIRFVELKMDIDRALLYAGQHRPEILKIKANERYYKARIAGAKADWYPTLTGSANYGYNDSNFVFDQISWGWGLALNFDVFTGGRRNAIVKESKENLVSISARRERLWQNIYLEVQQAYLNLVDARRRITMLEKSLEHARENFSLAQARYEVGLGDNLEFTDARLALQQAKTDLIKAILDYQIARSSLEKAVGLTVVRKEKAE